MPGAEAEQDRSLNLTGQQREEGQVGGLKVPRFDIGICVREGTSGPGEYTAVQLSRGQCDTAFYCSGVTELI